MLRDEIALYTKLSGNDGEHTAIGIIEAYLDGYNKGKEDRPTGKWLEIPIKRDLLYNTGIAYTCSVCGIKNSYGKPPYCMYCGAKMIKEAENE